MKWNEKLFLEVVLLGTYCSLNSVVVQSKKCPFRITTAIELSNITTVSDNNGFYRGVFQPTNVPELSGVFLFL